MKKITLHFKIQVLCTFLLFGFSGFSQEIDLTSLDQLEDPNNSGKTILINKSFDLGGNTLNIASGIILKPAGGILRNGTIAGSDFTISTDKTNRTFTNTITFKNLYKKTFFPEWYGARGNGTTDDSEALLNTFKTAEKVELRRYRTYFLRSPVLIDRTGTIQIEGNNVKITTAGFADKPALQFDNLFSQVTIENLEIDGENNSAGGIWASSSFRGDNLKLRNFYNEIDAAYGIHFEIEDRTVNMLLQNSNIDNVRAKNNGVIGDGPGTARAVRVYWRTSRPNSNVRIKDNRLTNIVAEDGDVIQIAQNNHQYINPTNTVISGNYIAFATRRLIKATASNVKIYGNIFENFKEGNKNAPIPEKRTYMVAFQIFDIRKVDNSQNGTYIEGAVFRNNTFTIDPNWNPGNGGILGLDRTNEAQVENNKFNYGRIVFRSFNQNTNFKLNNLNHSNIDFVDGPGSHVFNNFRIIQNIGTISTDTINRPVKGVMSFAGQSTLEDITIKNNNFTVTDKAGDKDAIALLNVDNGPDGGVIKILDNTLEKVKGENELKDPFFIRSSAEFGNGSKILNNKLIAKEDKTFVGLRFIGSCPESIEVDNNRNITTDKELLINGKGCLDSKAKTFNVEVNNYLNTTTIYNNSITGSLHILNWTETNSYYSIFDMSGKQIIKNKKFDYSIDTTLLTKGIYILHIYSNIEKKQFKFVKQ